jgi:SAM-dependent methyltransferase
MSSYDDFYSVKDFRRIYLADKGLISAIFRKLRLREGSLLDVGCGRGYFSNLIAKLSRFRVTGIDLSNVAIDIAMSNYGNRCHFLQEDFLDYPTSEKYDVVFCCQFSLLNVPELGSARSVVFKLAKHLKPNGYLVFMWCTDFTNSLKGGQFNHKLRQFTDFARSFPFANECFVTHPFIQVVLGRYCLNEFINTPIRIISQLLRMPGYRVVIVGRISSS